MEPSQPVTVVLADDQRAYRDGLARAIAAHRGLELAGVAISGQEALELIEAVRPDVALVDVRMSGMNGTEVCARLRERHPGLETRLVLMSAEAGGEPNRRADHAGADGFVPKDRSRREICEALLRLSRRPAGVAAGQGAGTI